MLRPVPPGVLLPIESVEDLAPKLSQLVRSARARGEPADPLIEALVSELGTAARAWRATSASSGNGFRKFAVETVSADDLTVREAASLLGRSDRHVRSLCETGKLPARRVGPRWLVDAEGVRRRVVLSRDSRSASTPGEDAS